MGRTLSEKILAHAAGVPAQAGDLLVVDVAMAMTVDSIGPSIIKILKDMDVERVHDPDRISLVIDHVAPASNVATAEGQRQLRIFAREQGIKHLFDVGVGICHQLLVEKRLVQPGTVALGSDSHSNIYGSLGCFGLGMGATDVALAFASGKTWMPVPETIRIVLSGSFPVGVNVKDLTLDIIRRMGADGATDLAVEFHGPAVTHLTLSQRMTLCGMTTEMGATVGLIPPDDLTRSLDGISVPDWLTVDDDATYCQTLDIDLGTLEPQIAVPITMDNVVPVRNVGRIKADVVFVGTCTNGRLADLQIVASTLKGQRVHPDVRLIIVPASHQVLTDAVSDGTVSTLLAAGATIGTPGCGPCMGRHMGVLAKGEVCLSTGNRNFAGRMGSPDAQVYVSSPEVAAATALTGYITDPREL